MWSSEETTSGRDAVAGEGRGLLVLVALLCGCSKSPEVELKTPLADAQGVSLATEAPQWRYLTLATAEEGPPLAPLPVPAHVELDPRRSSAVGTPLPGRVESVLVRAGSRVQKGDKLFSVKSGAYVELDRDAALARAQVTVNERLAARAKELFELKATAQKDVLTAEAELEAARLALKAAESKRRSLAVTAEGDGLFWVRAPRSGTIVELSASPGLEVTPEREAPLARLSDLDEVLVIADVPESESSGITPGAAAVIKSTSGVRAGAIEYVSEVVDPRRRTVEVWVRADNADRQLRPNAFVEVVLQPDLDQRVVRVPDAAVVTRGQSAVVFVVAAPGRLEPRVVKVGRRRDGETELHAGLTPGTRFVSSGALLLLNQVSLSSVR